MHSGARERGPGGGGELNLASLGKMKSAFEGAHKARFGFIDRSKDLVIEALIAGDHRVIGSHQDLTDAQAGLRDALRNVFFKERAEP